MKDVVISREKNVGPKNDGFSPAIINANAITEKKKVSTERKAKCDCILRQA